MQPSKSQRHVNAARARWRAADARAQAEREAGIPDRPQMHDARDTLLLDLRSHGGRCLRIEPRLGYAACRVIDADTGELLECAALKSALHRIADGLPRRLGGRAAR